MTEIAGDKVGVVLSTDAAPGVLHQLTGVIAKHHGDIGRYPLLKTCPLIRAYILNWICRERWIR